MENNMTLKEFNRYILRKINAEARLTMLEEESEEKSDETFVYNKRPSMKQIIEMQELGSKMNTVQTDIMFFSTKIQEFPTIKYEKFKFN